MIPARNSLNSSHGISAITSECLSTADFPEGVGLQSRQQRRFVTPGTDYFTGIPPVASWLSDWQPYKALQHLD